MRVASLRGLPCTAAFHSRFLFATCSPLFFVLQYSLYNLFTFLILDVCFYSPIFQHLALISVYFTCSTFFFQHLLLSLHSFHPPFYILLFIWFQFYSHSPFISLLRMGSFLTMATVTGAYGGWLTDGGISSDNGVDQGDGTEHSQGTYQTGKVVFLFLILSLQICFCICSPFLQSSHFPFHSRDQVSDTRPLSLS
ncbi:hypothetical protein VTO42DRAFT_4881 [Malbranchea cinnamomea]